ncbi:hypothetical protein Tsubulata_012338 [Turnera subulata]|uniref:Late embryogenesis abundant protein LEA-2 subgroup domain-containing protein n=1 Tax=Turnera subulata TaxID=218843 RepID=A0A9Q0G266_9ROSI|nr:hypothetical protein Tsubulata_012338 [Turnera subulata]
MGNCEYRILCGFLYIMAFGLSFYTVLPLYLYGPIFKFPKSHIPKVQVDSVTVDSFNIHSSKLTVNWDINLSVGNPNWNHEFRYKDARVSVFYQKKMIASSPVTSPFISGPIRARVSASSVHVDEWISRALADEWKRGGVYFTFRLDAAALKDYVFSSSQMTVSCEEVKVRAISGANLGNMAGSSTKCQVNML